MTLPSPFRALPKAYFLMRDLWLAKEARLQRGKTLAETDTGDDMPEPWQVASLINLQHMLLLLHSYIGHPYDENKREF